MKVLHVYMILILSSVFSKVTTVVHLADTSDIPWWILRSHIFLEIFDE